MKKIGIGIAKETRERLKKFGIMDSTFDSILNDLMDHCNCCDIYWMGK